MKSIIAKIESFLEWGGVKKDITLLAISGIALIISIFHLFLIPFDAAWIAIILCGVPIVLEAVIGLVTEFDIKADVLVSIALVASLVIGEDFAAGEVAFIMQLGALLEDLTVAKARAGIEKLVSLTPRTARVIKSGREETIVAEAVKVGDLVRVLPGETVPVDGVIVTGQTSINQAVMTGESIPVDKGIGDEVLSGTVNQFGAFDMKATKVGEDSSIQRMVRLVQSADADKAKIVGIADRWATYIVITALSAAIITWLITKEPIRAVTILVVFCPCALVLATPTAIMAAIGNATKHGFLVREGDALERLAYVKRITFDKTGTLTYGAPRVSAVEIFSDNISEDEFVRLSASAELLSEHPLGKAIICMAKEYGITDIEKPDEFLVLPGKGVRALTKAKSVIAGNRLMLEDSSKNVVNVKSGSIEGHKITLSAECKEKEEKYLKEGATLIYVVVDEEFAGFIALSDTLRENAKSTVGELITTGIRPVLLTGDNENAARAIAGKIGITDILYSCMPQDKLNYIDKSEKENIHVCMVGDGINDAPALKKAFVGIAMGGVGSDIAVDAADIVLVNDDIKEFPHLVRLSKHMMRVIKANLTFSMSLNFVAITLAITGILNPVIGALVHNAGSVFVILNSARLLYFGRK